MQGLPKRVLIAAGLPVAVAAIYGGSVAFAQSGEPTPSADGTPAAPTNPAPTNPGTPPNGTHNSADCPHMGDSGGSSDSSQGGATQQTRFAPRGSRGPSTTVRY